MTDARLPERWLNDRRIVRLTDGAFRTFTTSLLSSVANRTDGVIDTDDLDLVHGASSRHVPELVTAGLYAPHGSVHLIADFAATPTSRDELLLLENNRRQQREKKARQRARKAETASPGTSPGTGSPGTAPRDNAGQDRQDRQDRQALVGPQDVQSPGSRARTRTTIDCDWPEVTPPGAGLR